VRLFAAYWGSLLVVDVSRHVLVVAAASMIALSVACSIGQRLLVAAGIGATAWCFLTGFALNTYGDLTVHTSLDLVWLVVLVASALAAAGLTHLVRR
jgi:hypothetical protein